MGWSANVHAGVVEDEVIEVDKFAVQPQTGAGIGEVCPADCAVADWAFGQPLVEAGHSILGGGERADELGPGQRIGDFVGGQQGPDNPNGNQRNGS